MGNRLFSAIKPINTRSLDPLQYFFFLYFNFLTIYFSLAFSIFVTLFSSHIYLCWQNFLYCMLISMPFHSSLTYFSLSFFGVLGKRGMEKNPT